MFARDLRDDRHRRRADEPGGLGPPGRSRRPGVDVAGLRARQRRVLPLRRRPRGGHRRRRARHRPARRLDPRRRGHRGRRRARRRPWSSPAAATSATSQVVGLVLAGALAAAAAAPAPGAAPPADLSTAPLDRAWLLAVPAVYRLEVGLHVNALRTASGRLVRLPPEARDGLSEVGTAFGVTPDGVVVTADHVARPGGQELTAKLYRLKRVHEGAPGFTDAQAMAWVRADRRAAGRHQGPLAHAAPGAAGADLRGGARVLPGHAGARRPRRATWRCCARRCGACRRWSSTGAPRSGPPWSSWASAARATSPTPSASAWCRPPAAACSGAPTGTGSRSARPSSRATRAARPSTRTGTPGGWWCSGAPGAG